MHEILICIKSGFALIIVWCTDIFISKFALLPIVSPNIREVLMDCKDLISIFVSLSILILTIIKIRKEIKKGKTENE